MDSEHLVPQGYEEALLRVATLASLSPRSSDIQSLHAGIVLQALDALAKPSSPEEISSFARHRLGIELTLPAVASAVGVLDKEGKVKRESNLQVSIPPKINAELRAHATTLRDLQRSIIDAWLGSLDEELATDGRTELSAIERLQLEEDLQLFLLQLVRYHGAEVALFLYPVLDEVRGILNVDERQLFRELPARGDRILEMRAVAFPAFVREARGDRATYVAGLLHRAALLQILQTDAEASVLFAEILQDKTLYLDTNVVFRILGLQGSLLRDSSREILAIGERLKHKFAISTKTFDELENLVSRQASWLLNRDEIPPDLGAVAAEFVAGNDYVSAYWRDRRTKGISAEKFQEALGDMPLLLENFDIEVSATMAAEVYADPKFREAVGQLKVFKPHDHQLLVEHDAFHKNLIELLRERDLGREPKGWYEAGFLFLTFDNTLPLFAARAHERGKGHQVPFCLLGHEWLEILHLANPSAEISAEAFVALVNSPYLESFFFRRALDRDLVREIALTMGEMQEYRPRVARKIYANRAVIKRLDAMSDEGERLKAIREAVKLEGAEEDQRLDALLAEKDDELERLRRQISKKDEEIERAGRALHEEIRVRKRKEERASTTRERLENERSGLQVQVRKLQTEVSALAGLRSAYEGLKDRVVSLEEQTDEMSAKAARSSRFVLLLPSLLFVYALGQLLLPGGAKSIVWWLALGVGAAPFVFGLWRRFEGRVWELLNRAAAVITVCLFLWEAVGLKNKFVTWLHRIGALFADT